MDAETKERLETIDALDGLFAHDGGAFDSGIRDDKFKAEVVKRDDIEQLLEQLLLRIICGPEYGIRDAARFIDWIRDSNGLDLAI
jgi:hypothetical protein